MCRDIVRLYPAHDPRDVEKQEQFGFKNTRYETYEAPGNVWIPRPFPIHAMVNRIYALEAEVNKRLDHYQDILRKFVQ